MIIRNEQDRKCTHSITLRSNHVTTDAIKKKLVLHILNVCL